MRARLSQAQDCPLRTRLPSGIKGTGKCPLPDLLLDKPKEEEGSAKRQFFAPGGLGITTTTYDHGHEIEHGLDSTTRKDDGLAHIWTTIYDHGNSSLRNGLMTAWRVHGHDIDRRKRFFGGRLNTTLVGRP